MSFTITNYGLGSATSDFVVADNVIDTFTIERTEIPDHKKVVRFNDVKLGATYYRAVMYAVDNGLFNGTSETTFSPDTAMNRAMFVTVLGRLDKADVTAYTVPTFSDVKAGEWYASYVEWATANGIVNGVGNGIFDINGEITVEQACIMLARYAVNKSTDKPIASIADFSDADSVSDWANDGVEWAVNNGIYRLFRFSHS